MCAGGIHTICVYHWREEGQYCRVAVIPNIIIWLVISPLPFFPPFQRISLSLKSSLLISFEPFLRLVREVVCCALSCKVPSFFGHYYGPLLYRLDSSKNSMKIPFSTCSKNPRSQQRTSLPSCLGYPVKVVLQRLHITCGIRLRLCNICISSVSFQDIVQYFNILIEFIFLLVCTQYGW